MGAARREGSGDKICLAGAAKTGQHRKPQQGVKGHAADGEEAAIQCESLLCGIQEESPGWCLQIIICLFPFVGSNGGPVFQL